MTVFKRAGRAVHVESHLHELRNHALDLLVVRAFLHYDHHKILDCFTAVRAGPHGRPPSHAAATPMRPTSPILLPQSVPAASPRR